MKKNQKGSTLVLVLLVAAVAVAAWLWLAPQQAAAPYGSETAGSSLSADDTTSAIDKELKATDIGDPVKDLQATDAAVNSL